MGKKKNEIENAKLQEKQTQLANDYEEKEFITTITDLINQLPVLRDDINISLVLDTLSQKRYIIANRLFQTGKISLLELESAQIGKDYAKKNYISALRKFWEAYYLLKTKTIEDLYPKNSSLLKGSIAWSPFAILMFGIGNMSSVFIVFLGGFFPIFISTVQGIESFPEILKNISSTYRLKGVTFFRRVIFPYTLPYIFTGMKIGIGMCWMCLIAAELISAQNGLGYFIQINRLLLRSENILLGMLIIATIGFLLNRALDAARFLLMPWEK